MADRPEGPEADGRSPSDVAFRALLKNLVTDGVELRLLNMLLDKTENEAILARLLEKKPK